MTRVVSLVCLFLVLAFLLAVPLALKAQQQAITVIEHACDNNGAVTALRLRSTEAGVITLVWDNRLVCGTRT